MVYSGHLTHFGHKNILKHSNRPFKTIEEHDIVLIERWNSKVSRRDTIFHLGDFCWRNFDYYFNKLNGSIRFVEGNHDELAKKNKKRFASYDKLLEIKIKNQSIVLCHYALVTWRKKHYGSIMLAGHSHHNLPAIRRDGTALGKILDVGVDGNNYYPYSLDEVLNIMSEKPLFSDKLFRDHHGFNKAF